MSITTTVLKSSGVKITAYVSMKDPDTILGIVSNNELHLLSPLSKLGDKCREKMIGKMVSKARNKFGIKATKECFDSSISIVDGEAHYLTTEPHIQ